MVKGAFTALRAGPQVISDPRRRSAGLPTEK
jgi:hypothetical protein